MHGRQPALFSYISGTPLLTWISNHMLSKVWDEITYSFLNFNSATIEGGMDK